MEIGWSDVALPSWGASHSPLAGGLYSVILNQDSEVTLQNLVWTATPRPCCIPLKFESVTLSSNYWKGELPTEGLDQLQLGWAFVPSLHGYCQISHVWGLDKIDSPIILN